MRIAHVVAVYPPYRGGIGHVAEEYVEGLRAAGHEVVVFTPNYKKALSWGKAALMPGLIWKLKGFDVIHLHYPFYGGAFFAALASLLWRTPLVLTYHMKTKADGWLGWVFKWHRVLLEPFILGDANHILVSSNDYAESVGLKRYRFLELPFGIDGARFSPAEDLSDDECTFLFVGGMDEAHYFKGVPFFLEVLSRLPTDLAWKAEFVGDGALRSGYEEQARKLGLASRVRFLGRVSEEELPKIYREASVHVLPSIDRSEAYGLVTLEAAFSGLPSLVSDLPGVRSLVNPGVTGFVCGVLDIEEWKQRCELLIRGTEDRKDMGRRARQRAEQEYDKRRLLAQLIDAYKSVTVNQV